MAGSLRSNEAYPQLETEAASGVRVNEAYADFESVPPAGGRVGEAYAEIEGAPPAGLRVGEGYAQLEVRGAAYIRSIEAYVTLEIAARDWEPTICEVFPAIQNTNDWNLRSQAGKNDGFFELRWDAGPAKDLSGYQLVFPVIGEEEA